MSYGFASNLRDALPNASFIGFTGTPIEKTSMFFKRQTTDAHSQSRGHAYRTKGLSGNN